ncbi:septal ring lytic transglycosylase RlpA family protein [Salinispora arenicola]|uniref:septal ring lytic transglycosylase RlpA family protein n=1 Tax=Salinispora arenicola TaxID=168697 RepID=UPI00207A5F16|nr:septal ring lytic transglycosylase RlpA family protein [Salinispora arenicola]MCN0154760.1 septal ring lytic transglycosylase RlpA family protein [Salinispora arenicola]
MAGRHARTRRFSPTAIAATAAVGVALAIGGTVGAVRLTSGDVSDRSVAAAPTEVDPPAAASAPLSVPPSGSPSASGSRSAGGSPSLPSPIASPASVRKTQAPSRSKPRTATPQPTATNSSAPAVETGSCGASYYSEGQLTASGEPFDPSAMTAAHKTLPFDTRVRVTNPATGTSVTVRINDRGPFVEGRCIDLSRAAFAEIAPLNAGHVEVRYEVLG